VLKDTCPVWSGGKAVRPYLSLLRAKIYHKPIEPLHRPFEAMAEEAKARERNACADMIKLLL
jgi:hypothetical protein